MCQSQKKRLPNFTELVRITVLLENSVSGGLSVLTKTLQALQLS